MNRSLASQAWPVQCHFEVCPNLHQQIHEYINQHAHIHTYIGRDVYEQIYIYICIYIHIEFHVYVFLDGHCMTRFGYWTVCTGFLTML